MPTELPVGPAAEFDDLDRKIVLQEDGQKIGVFRVGDRFVAYENRCLHQGGPVCEGKIFGKVEAVLEEDRNVVREKHSDTTKHLVCPWHGYEYNLETGAANGDPNLKLSQYEVVERDGMVYVLV